ncbi:ankyrin repeat domain-containing protein [Azomonas macrocytogenes]|uniref:Ankyrin repeat domain-containing protein n=1 Tax=Azomonas macrocytogenes TaxID=69962 RepID=A0A839T8A4_AZOMA|nr:ankyrin repeat domain-containing protein [Azomonas macrocytogenes]MBB3104484.1 hypothetical protein [Azomonas macrocytogenes]
MSTPQPNAVSTTRQMTPEEAQEFADQVFDVARNGDASMLVRLLDNDLPPNLRNHKGDTLLILASYHGHLDASRVLLEHGADPDICNDNGHTALAGSGFKGNLAMAKLLLSHGANVEAKSPDGKTALMMAAMFDRTDIVALLLQHGANPQVRDAKGITAFAAAQAMGAKNTSAQLAALMQCDG